MLAWRSLARVDADRVLWEKIKPQHPAIKPLMNKVRWDPDGCWIWAGGVDENGYGKLRLRDPHEQKQRVYTAHRLTYILAFGPIADGLVLDHLCCNTRCVRPSHLEPVTSGENSKRMQQRRTATMQSTLNAAKTHCPQGHAYTPENLIKDGRRRGRVCRTCKLVSMRARYHRRKLG